MWKMGGIETIPGGSCLNSIRSTNFMLKDTHPGKVGYFGCIGKDDYGKVLEEELKVTGVRGYFHKDETTPTGTCAVIIKNKDRAMCANLGACVKYPKQHLLDNIEIVKRASLIYTTAFFITSNYEALLEVAKLAAESNKPLGYNLSAGFLI
jgi:adenosine kinase